MQGVHIGVCVGCVCRGVHRGACMGAHMGCA